MKKASGSICHCAFFFLCFLLLTACGGNNGRFELEGHFKNMNQGELFIYDMESGARDTIEVRDGRFEFETEIHDTTTYILLFPNFSELPILARPGATVTIEGDVSHLIETDIEGNKENEELTALRKKLGQMLPPQAKKEVSRFITAHPESPACHYLLRRYFLLDAEPNYDEAARLCRAIRKRQPRDRQLLRLGHQLARLTHTQDTIMPSFTAISTEGDTIDNTHLKAKANIVVAWANWDNTSQSTLSLLRKLQRQHPDSIAVVSVSMDATAAEGRQVLKRDSITWPNICDGEMWQSPLVELLGITTLPYNMVADSTGHIVGRNLSNADIDAAVNRLLRQ